MPSTIRHIAAVTLVAAACSLSVGEAAVAATTPAHSHDHAVAVLVERDGANVLAVAAEATAERLDPVVGVHADASRARGHATL